MSIRDDIAAVSLFSDLSEDMLDSVEKIVINRHFDKNTILVHEGDESLNFYMINKGRVKVFLTDDKGKELTVNVMGPGEYFGEMSLVDNDVRSASVMTTEKSELLIIRKNDFLKLLLDQPAISMQLLQCLSARIRSLIENVKSLALEDVYGRVVKTLLSLADEREGALVINEKLTQQDIANRVGASREMVAKIMKDLSMGGYISYTRKQIIIKEQLPKHY